MEESCGEHTFQPAETGGVRVGPRVLSEVYVVRTSRGVDVARGRVGGNPESSNRLHLEVGVGSERAGDEGVAAEDRIGCVGAELCLISRDEELDAALNSRKAARWCVGDDQRTGYCCC